MGEVASKVLKRAEPPESSLEVTLTTYTIEVRQTDADPLTTASGMKLDKRNPRKHKVVAISRDLKAYFNFGDTLVLTNAGALDGVYCVQDVMNKRFTNKIDILLNPKDKHTKILKAKIKKKKLPFWK